MTSLPYEELQLLPPVVDVQTAARVLGIGRGVAYGLIRAGQWPTPVLHLGKQIRIPVAPLLELLGVRVEDPPAQRSASLS